MTCDACRAENAATAVVCARCGKSLAVFGATIGAAPSITSGGGRPHTTASRAEAALVGDLIANRYVLRAMLGRGGVGVVYRATDRVLGEEIAIKLLHPDPNRDPSEIERFKREILTAKKITHPNVVRIDYFGFVDDTEAEAFLAMELLAGGSLTSRIAAGVTIEAAADIALGIANGLHAAHERGIIHRDIKPDNVLFDEAGTPKLLDFGLARFASATTRTQGFSGTPYYMAPEQADGGDASVASDVYSLGVLLFELFTGQLPFKGESLVRLVIMHTKEPPPRPRSVRPELPEEIERLILTALEKQPARRHKSAAEIARAIESWKASRRPEHAAARTPPRASRTKTVLAAAIAGLGALAAAAFFSGAIGPLSVEPAPTPVADLQTPAAVASAASAATAIATATPGPVAAASLKPSRTRVAVGPTPATTSAVRAAKKGKLVVSTERGVWANVHVGGALHEAPFLPIAIDAGDQVLRFENASLGFSSTQTVKIVPGATVEFRVLKGNDGKLVVKRIQ